MKTAKYTLRAVKYLVKLTLLFAALFALMIWSGTSNFSFDLREGFLTGFFSSSRGRLFAAAVLVWCAIYPRVEFIVRNVGGDLRGDKLSIIRALDAGGMILASEREGSIVFHSRSPLRRVLWMWDDSVTLTQKDGRIIIEGPRRFVMEAEHRIPACIESDKNND